MFAFGNWLQNAPGILFCCTVIVNLFKIFICILIERKYDCFVYYFVILLSILRGNWGNGKAWRGLTFLYLKVSAPVQVSKDKSTEKETINVLICMLRTALRQLLGNLCIYFIHTRSYLSVKRNVASLWIISELRWNLSPVERCEVHRRPLVGIGNITPVGGWNGSLFSRGKKSVNKC